MPASESLSWPWRFSHWPVGPNYKTCVLAWDPRVIFGNLRDFGIQDCFEIYMIAMGPCSYCFSPLYLGFIAQAWDRNKVKDKYIFYFQNRVSNVISLGLLHPRIVHPAYGCACLLVVVAGQSVHLCKQFCFTQFACHPAHTPGHNMLAKYLWEEEKNYLKLATCFATLSTFQHKPVQMMVWKEDSRKEKGKITCQEEHIQGRSQPQRGQQSHLAWHLPAKKVLF